MWSKVLISSLAVCVVLMMVVIIPIGQASAIGVDTAIKLVGGKAVVRSLAEEAGLMLAPKTLDNVVEVIQKKTYDGDARAIDFVNKANDVIDMPSSDPASKTGFKKYVLDPMLWLTGLDLILDAVNGFNDGYNSGTSVEVYGFPKYGGFESFLETHASDSSYWSWGFEWSETGSKVWSASMMKSSNPGVSVSITNVAAATATTLDIYYHMILNKSTGAIEVIDSKQNVAKPTDYETVMLGKPKTITPDLVDTAPITNIKNEFDNDTYNTNTTYNLEIEMPENINDYYDYDNDTTNWNDVDPQLELEVDSGDGDIPTDGSDSDNDDGHGDSIDVLVRVDDEIPIHEKFFLEMADMGQKVEDMYNGVTHFFQVSTDGFQSLTDGMSGYVAFLDDFFDWLPSEYVALLGSGFTLGVVSFFLRR